MEKSLLSVTRFTKQVCVAADGEPVGRVPRQDDLAVHQELLGRRHHLRKPAAGKDKSFSTVGVQHSTMISILASLPRHPRFDSQHSRNNVVDVAEVNQWRR